MELSLIKTEQEYDDLLAWVDDLLDQKIAPDSPLGKKLELAILILKNYEDTHYSIPYPDPIEAVKSKMSELGIKNKDLVGKIGSKGYVSSILNKRKPMTLEIAKILHRELKIPAEILLS